MKSPQRILREMLEGVGMMPPTHRPELSDYLNPAFVRAIRRLSVRTIFEFGCNDGEDTLRLRDKFGAVVHAFECNPEMLPKARARLAGERDVVLVERAVWDADEPIPFYPVIHTTQNGRVVVNPGASSCFRTVSGYHQEYVQSEVMVEATRLDTYCKAKRLEGPDLLCMDVQGAALHALRGLGNYINRVQAVITEIEDREIFIGEDLYPAVDKFLTAAGFSQALRIEREGWFCDHLYLRR